MGFFSKLFGGKPQKPTFYVFGLQGPAFGQPQGDVMPEKAKALKDGYAPAANMALTLVRPNQWGGQVNASNSGGVVSVSIGIRDHEPAIRSYLQKAGVKAAAIDKGLADANEHQLILTNPFSGVTVIGVPIE